MFKIKEGPELLPIKARFWIVPFGLAALISMYLFKSNTFYQLTAFGILLSMFGAGVLYWETVVNDEEAIGVYHQIAKEGGSRSLTESEQKSVLWFFQAGALEFILILVLFIYEIRHGKSFSLVKTVQIPIILFLASFGPMIGVYAMLKFMRISNYNNSMRMQNLTDKEKVVLVRVYLRRFGFKALFVSGLLQYLGILVDHYYK